MTELSREMPAWLARAQALVGEPANDVSGLGLVPPAPRTPLEALAAEFASRAAPTVGADGIARRGHAQCVAATILGRLRTLDAAAPQRRWPGFWTWLTAAAERAGDDAWRAGLEVCRAWSARHGVPNAKPAPTARTRRAHGDRPTPAGPDAEAVLAPGTPRVQRDLALLAVLTPRLVATTTWPRLPLTGRYVEETPMGSMSGREPEGDDAPDGGRPTTQTRGLRLADRVALAWFDETRDEEDARLEAARIVKRLERLPRDQALALLWAYWHRSADALGPGLDRDALVEAVLAYEHVGPHQPRRHTLDLVAVAEWCSRIGSTAYQGRGELDAAAVYGVEGAAALLGVDRKTIERRCRDGSVSATRTAGGAKRRGHWRIRGDDLRAFRDDADHASETFAYVPHTPGWRTHSAAPPWQSLPRPRVPHLADDEAPEWTTVEGQFCWTAIYPDGRGGFAWDPWRLDTPTGMVFAPIYAPHARSTSVDPRLELRRRADHHKRAEDAAARRRLRDAREARYVAARKAERRLRAAKGSAMNDNAETVPRAAAVLPLRPRRTFAKIAPAAPTPARPLEVVGRYLARCPDALRTQRAA